MTPPPPLAPRTVLVLRALGLGDLLTAVPALRGLRRAFPGHRIVLATPGRLAPLAGTEVDEVLAHPDVDTPLPRTRVEVPVDVAVNLHGCGPRSHALLDRLHPARRIGHGAPGWAGPPWRGDTADRQRWCDLLAWHGIPADAADLRLPPPGRPSPLPRAAVVHPGAGYPAKQWPVGRFAEVARTLAAGGHPVAVTGSAAERELTQQVVARAGLGCAAQWAGRTSLGELAALVSRAAVLVCGDTGIAHLATAYRTPSVVLFGPVPATRWGPPPGGPHITLSADGYRRGDPFADRPDPALLGVAVPDVLAALRRLTNGG